MIGEYDRYLAVFAGFILLVGFGCASKTDVLSEVDSSKSGEKPIGAFETAANPAAQKARQLLEESGYSGVGLEYENDNTLQFLTQIFSDARTRNRQIKLVYTGLNLSYDSRYQSLTVGGTRNADAVIAYIIKNIPLRSPS